jgi:hypothetical protein
MRRAETVPETGGTGVVVEKSANPDPPDRYGPFLLPAQTRQALMQQLSATR